MGQKWSRACGSCGRLHSGSFLPIVHVYNCLPSRKCEHDASSLVLHKNNEYNNRNNQHILKDGNLAARLHLTFFWFPTRFQVNRNPSCICENARRAQIRLQKYDSIYVPNCNLGVFMASLQKFGQVLWCEKEQMHKNNMGTTVTLQTLLSVKVEMPCRHTHSTFLTHPLAISLKRIENSTQQDQRNQCDEVLRFVFTHQALLLLKLFFCTWIAAHAWTEK